MAIVRWTRPTPVWPSFLDDELFNSWPQLSSEDKGLNIYETDDSVVVEASLPGIPEDNVEVTVEGNVLTISGSFEEHEEDTKKKKVVYKSSRQSSFSYSTSLPRMVDSTKATAEVKDGVVTVTVPLTEEEKPKKITVTKRK
ncbi:MAG: Hsp20/alpha crystallin family protein [Patescibacteria group bacterium]|uniref:Hsp20/alpha crystallin family protein n=1 Tax=candidate division WWE3 bacterium TaxID=2053526 RepID=A0A955EDD3_UNCKA|nr:Hsp20/alpha crystallin family protein [candidate division WWE3 bacterium]